MKTGPVMSVLTVAMTLTISSCATNGSPGAHARAVAKKNSAAANLSASSTTAPTATALAKVTCENPITLDDSKLKPLTEKSEFTDAKYAVSQMQVYWVDEANNNSYAASTGGSGGDFSSVHLDCNGTKGLNAQSSFKASSDMNVSSGAQSATQWALDLKFEKGTLTGFAAHLVKDKPTAEKPGDKIPLERTKVGDDTYVTIRYYALPSGKLEVRMKTEFKADANGKRVVQYATATYEAK